MFMHQLQKYWYIHSRNTMQYPLTDAVVQILATAKDRGLIHLYYHHMHSQVWYAKVSSRCTIKGLCSASSPVLRGIGLYRCRFMWHLYFGLKVRNQILTYEKTGSINLGNACYQLFHNFCFPIFI